MNNLPSLYKISADMAAIISALEENGGEVTPEIEQAMSITEDQFTAKSVDYGQAIITLRSMAAAAKEEKERLANLQKFYENAEKRLSGALLNAMELFGKPKVETPTMRLTARHTAATVIEDLDMVPKQYTTTKVEVVADKKAIKEAIMGGEDVPGARVVENVSLQIK